MVVDRPALDVHVFLTILLCHNIGYIELINTCFSYQIHINMVTYIAKNERNDAFDVANGRDCQET